MADKRIDELDRASQVTDEDLLVLQQSGAAKSLTGRILRLWLLQLADGHGGISDIEKTGSAGTNPVVDTYTITFADETTTTFNVTNGVKGDTGDQTYVYIKYSNREPIADSDLTDTPSAWMGICATTAATAPTTYGSYSWYEIKGAKGDPGNDITISSTSVMYQAWTSGTQYPTGTWLANPPAVTPGNYLWTRTIVNYSDGGQTVSYSSARWGMDGSGAVGSVNSQLPDQDGNVTLTANDVGALPDSYQPPVTSVNNKTGTVVLDYSDVNAPYGKSVSATLSSTGWYRVCTTKDVSGAVISFTIGRPYGSAPAQAHKIDFFIVGGGNSCFMNEVSDANNLYVDKIRCTYGGGNVHFDIHYNANAAETIYADFVVGGNQQSKSEAVSEGLAPVVDAPTGETILETYAFENFVPYYGTNSTGSYQMFSDGTLICWVNVTLSDVAITSSWDGIYESPWLGLGYWPKAFVSMPTISLVQDYSGSSQAAMLESVRQTSATYVGQANFWRPNSATVTTVKYKIVGIGRWK